MGNYWLLLVIIASLSHAFWNIMLKQSEDKTIFLWSLRVWSVILFLPVSIVLWPKDEHITSEWVLMGLGSILLHSLYALILSKAYEKNDFTLTYPIARGLGPLIVVAVGVMLLKEPFTWMSIVGSVLIFTGIFVLYTGLGRGGQSIRSMFTSPYPLLVGLSIAGYTLFDKLAVSIIHPVSLNVIENMGQVLLLGSLQVRG
ncbi:MULTISPECIES: SMR family transporter [Paenibacillus]|nr:MULTISPECIES: SMR family transporter [Paenibacillus]